MQGATSEVLTPNNCVSQLYIGCAVDSYVLASFSGIHQVNHFSAEIHSVGSSESMHDEQLRQGVRENRLTPLTFVVELSEG